MHDLGLHLDASPLLEQGRISEEELYVRSRTFWGIWSLDKEFSALVGRPSCLRGTVCTCLKPGYWELEDLVGFILLIRKIAPTNLRLHLGLVGIIP